jgi:hypothetical protein
MIFDRRPLPPGAPPEMHDLARMLAAAAGPAEPRELAGEATALAAFARLASPVGISSAALRPARRRLPRRPARARLPLAAALVTAAAGLGSITAAYVDVLPGPLQQVAHVTVGAPLPAHSTSRRLPAVTNPPLSVTHDHGASSPRSSRSAARTQVHGSVNRHRPRYELPGRHPVPATSICTPGAVPTPTPVKPSPSPSLVKASPSLVKPSPTPGLVKASPTPSVVKPSATSSPPEPGASGWTPQLPPSAACLDIATPNAVPPPSW